MSDEEKGYEPPGWLLTYGDMVTLLVTFFVMLISLSTINVDKYKKTMTEVQKAFEGGSGGEFLLEGGKSPVENPFEQGMYTPESYEIEEQIETSTEHTDDTYHYLSNFIKESVLAKYVDIEDIKIGCTLKIPVDLCFERDDTILKRESFLIFRELGTLLRVMKGKIIIDANLGKVVKPMVTEETDLSTERAVNILNFFINRENVEPQRIAIAGYNTSEIDNEDIIRIIVLKK